MDQSTDIIQHMEDCGIFLSTPVVADGRIHRFRNRNDHEKNAWYIFFEVNGNYRGAFGDWKLDVNLKISASRMSENNFLDMEKMINEARHKRILEQAKIAEIAVAIWESAQKQGTSEYLTKKKVSAFGVRFAVSKLGTETIVVPMRGVQGDLKSLQFIAPDGKKRFLTGGQAKGCCHIIGDLHKDNKEIFFAEGYATAASVHMATKRPVVVFFYAANLLEVWRLHRLLLDPGSRRCIIVADDDYQLKVNVGLEVAVNCICNTKGEFRLPKFSGSQRGTDFNDLHCIEGLHAVKKQLDGSSRK